MSEARKSSVIGRKAHAPTAGVIANEAARFYRERFGETQ
jgi:hypothetical protein